ncbi:MAG: hypothetical protein AVO38_01945 [delta proteobacterium ML8_D]|nr:MAG: hypothetical protein AVO38_01945 [delta proteobacterium ML8_D]
MEQALEVRVAERAEVWDQVAVDVADQADLLQVQVETVSALNVVNACHIRLQLLVLSENVPSAGL